MNIATPAKLTLGSLVVYVAVAACSGGSTFVQSTKDASVSQDSSLDALADSVVDAVTDPVGEAQAAPPTIATESCNKTFVLNSATYVYAEHSFAGKSKDELALVHTSIHFLQGQGAPPPGYANQQGTPWLKDGSVAQWCGIQPNPFADTVTFVLP